ncbi:MAG: hypothetical protein LWX11_10975 [Firmicutes bacterium]|nr:hypothetical protein [Bacillota bacterium]
MAVHAGLRRAFTERQRQSSAAWVRRLDLTDLCLFTEARYTRHPAMADRHAAFQDHPSALDHFPSGSLLKPPSFPSPHASAPATPPKHP